jgi:Ca2+-binding EF-hand superfamily protein
LTFNPIQAYRLFLKNPENGRNITLSNLKQAFDFLKIKLSKSDCLLLMKRFDSNRDGQLTYTDICDIFKPKDKYL